MFCDTYLLIPNFCAKFEQKPAWFSHGHTLKDSCRKLTKDYFVGNRLYEEWASLLLKACAFIITLDKTTTCS